MNNQKGFTLIELIVVIVILGILSAVAVPKFVDMQSEAHLAKVEAARGAFKAGIMMVHGKSLASQTTTGYLEIYTGTSVNMSGGWPILTGTTPDTCDSLFNKLVDEDIEAAATGTAKYFVTTGSSATVCTFSDTESGKPYSFTYTLADGVVSKVNKP